MTMNTLYEKIVARSASPEARIQGNSLELEQMAWDLDNAFSRNTSDLLSTYTRIRRRWCEISGEPIVSPTVSKIAERLFRLSERAKLVEDVGGGYGSGPDYREA